MDSMIKVEGLTKRYAGVTALQDVSFTVKRGEIVGFLGPNGAGKSTTMRILTGFIPASAGRVEVAGLDVFEDSLAVRRHIGYMPENNPLYEDMRVCEYLKFRAKLKDVRGAERKERIDDCMEMTGVTDVRRRVIGQLSKGYRQRVGLADALLGDPDLLILDEPTIGLDPVQIRQVRQLIKDLGKKHTILISTHILPEVEMTCNRVLIIHRGKILASDAPENLMKTLSAGAAVRVEVAALPDAAVAALSELPDVASVTVEAGSDGYARLRVQPRGDVDVRPAIYQKVVAERWDLRELSRGRTSLEDVFVQVTRDEDEAEEDRRDQRQRLR
jgi:ABC-2 type transport system ATP-binding protein